MTQDRAARAASVRDSFREYFGAAPSLLAAAPGRINLIGEHTDYNDGFVLPAGIDRDAVVSLRQNDLNRYRLVALDLGERVEVDLEGLAPRAEQWANYLLGVVAALHGRGLCVPGFDCVLTCDVPQGAGLSSSAAIECALAVGLDALCGFGLDKWTLASVGQVAENDFVGANTGILDQFASVFAEDDTALLLDCRSREVRRQTIRLPGHRLVVLNTGVKHNHLTSGYADRRADCERAVEQLRGAGWTGRSLRDLTIADLGRFAIDGRGREVVDQVAFRRATFIVRENERVLLAAEQLDRGDVRGFGESLLAGHRGLSELYEVSCPESDAVVEFAAAHPAARGARQMGGGFGGCVLCVVEEGSTDDFVDAAQRDYEGRFAMVLERLDVEVGPGARLLGAAGALDRSH